MNLKRGRFNRFSVSVSVGEFRVGTYAFGSVGSETFPFFRVCDVLLPTGLKFVPFSLEQNKCSKVQTNPVVARLEIY